MSKKIYNIDAVLKLIRAAFDADSFLEFCYIHFSDVYQQFLPGQDRRTLERKLVEHAHINGHMDRLLSEIEKANTYQYEHFEADLILSNDSLVQDEVRGAADILPDISSLFASVIRQRMQVMDWKQLHEDCQKINIELVVLRGVIVPVDVELALRDLEMHWTLCSDRINRFVMLEGLSDRSVKQQFIKTHQNRLTKLQLIAENMDEFVRECITDQDFLERLEDIREVLMDLDLSTVLILEFLDGRLKRAIRDLEEEIETLRTILTLSEISIGLGVSR